MPGNKVSPSQPENNIDQVQGSPSDQAGEQPANAESTVKRDTTQLILQDINAKECLCNEESDEKKSFEYINTISCLSEKCWSICHCGKYQENNGSNVENQENKIDEERTNYFGEIAFDSNHTAKHILVHSNTTKPETVLNLMKEQWKLEIPALLISVHGSMKSFKTCQTSLMKAVHGTGSWIITEGKQEYVNTDETADQQPIIIGISQWGAIHNKHQMDNHQGSNPAKYPIDKSSLDPNHSHFVLIDDGHQYGSNTEINFMDELESAIAKIESVPLVLLVLEWDEKIKKTVQNALTRKIPVVIVTASDGEAYGLSSDSEIPEDISKHKLSQICKWNSWSDDFDIGLAILKALSKATMNNVWDNMNNAMYQLKLAFAWNRIDIAKKNISTKTISHMVQSLDDFMMTAILMDRMEFVELLLQNGFDLKTFLTKERQEKSYNKNPAFKEILTNMRSSKKEDSEGKDTIEKTFILEDVVKDLVQYLYDDSGLQFTRYVNRGKGDTNHTTETKQADRSEQTQSDDDDRYLELLVFSVINHCQNVAKFFWRRGKDAMPAALFAHALLSAISHQIDDRDFKEKCKKHKREFTNLAIEILKEGYTKGGVNLAKKLLIQQHERWEKTSCVLIAVNAKNKDFISEHACQAVFNYIWMGKINQETGILCNNLKLLLCIFFPLLILVWIKFRKEDKKPSDPLKVLLSNCITRCKNDPQSNHTDQQEKENTRCSSEQGVEPTIWNKIKYFYQAPVVKCFHNVILYMLFLGLYSYILMTKFDRYLSWQEILLCVWVFTIFIQEVIQVRSTPSKGWKKKLSNYVKDGWNILDIVTLFLFLCGMILRIIDNKHVAESAHVVHGVNLITFYLRLLHIFSVHRKLGPKLVMIIHMVYIIAYFFMILVVFIVAYGIASHSILYPHTEPSFETFTEIFRRPYWNIYGELMLDKFEGSADCTNDPELYKTGTYSRCPTESGKYFVPLLLGVYMLMCNILLLNLLIAMFSSTFQKVQENSYLYWCFQQYSLINEYANRPVLVPPVIIFKHLYQLIQWIRNCCKEKRCKCDADIKPVFCRFYKGICDVEKQIVRDYKNGLEHISSNVSEADPANLEKRMEQMEKQLNRLEQMQREILEKLGSSKALSR